MIEYKAYHKTGTGNRVGGKQAVRKKGKSRGAEGSPPETRLRAAAWLSAVLAAVALLGGASAYAYSRLTRSSMFSVRSIEMNSCPNVTKEEVWSIVRGGGKRNIWTIPVRDVSRRLASHPWIRSVSVRKSFPDRLVVRIEEHRPVAMVNLDALWYVDDEGQLFKRLTAYDPKNLAVVTGFSVGDLRAKDAVAMRNFRSALELLRLAEAGPLRKNLSEVHFDAQDGYTLVTRDTGVQFRIGGMEFHQAIRRIEEALPRVSALGKSPGIVDLKTEGRIFVRPGE
jgi:cell division protein FtsQ